MQTILVQAVQGVFTGNLGTTKGPFNIFDIFTSNGTLSGEGVKVKPQVLVSTVYWGIHSDIPGLLQSVRNRTVTEWYASAASLAIVPLFKPLAPMTVHGH